jgi:hypothetical protein
VASLAELLAWRDALTRARLTGVRLVRHGDKELHYKNDAEMRDALAAADALIAGASGKPSPTTILFATSKGL